MAATRLLMRRLRELLRLKYEAGLNHRAIAQACAVGLLHEQVHRCGGGEPDAYARELAFLKQHNADPEVIADVEELLRIATEDAQRGGL